MRNAGGIMLSKWQRNHEISGLWTKSWTSLLGYLLRGNSVSAGPFIIPSYF